MYVEKLKPILSIRPYTNQNIDLLFLNFNDSEVSPLMYRPATGLNVGGEIAFSFLHFNYQRNLPLLQPSQAGNMEPTHQRIGFNIGGKIFGMEMTFQKNRGFYLMNPKSIPEIYQSSSDVLYRPDMTSTTFGLDFRFTFSNKLSANAIFDQSERQKKSKGAFTIIIGDRFHSFHSGDPILPLYTRTDYVESSTVNKIWVNNLHFQPGYGYIAVAGNWNFGLFLYTGGALQLRKYFDKPNDIEKLGVRIPFILKGKTGISYNGDYFYARLTGTADYTTLGMKDANFSWFQSYWELSVGLRFLKKK